MHVSGWKCVIFVYKTPCWSIIWPVTLSSEMIFWMKGLLGKLNWTSVTSNSDTSSCINPPTLYSSIGFLRKRIVYFAEYFNIFETFFFLLDISSFLVSVSKKMSISSKMAVLILVWNVAIRDLVTVSSQFSHYTHNGKGSQKILSNKWKKSITVLKKKTRHNIKDLANSMLLESVGFERWL